MCVLGSAAEGVRTAVIRERGQAREGDVTSAVEYRPVHRRLLCREVNQKA
jgi:hypothetical protein